MKIIDYAYSKEEFNLFQIKKGILKLQNIPFNLKSYYDHNQYISHVNNKRKIIDFLYLIFQKYNMYYKFKIIKKYSNKKNIIDFGCGNGAFLSYIKKKKYFIQGCDLFIKNKIKIQTKLGITLNNKIEHFNSSDIITMWHVLEHLKNPLTILKKLEKKLNKNGIIIISVPNYESFDSKYYKNFWAAYDVPRHIYHYSKNGFIDYFSKYFNIIAIEPLLLDSYYISLLSEYYKNNKLSAFLKAFLIGWKSNKKAKKNKNYSSLIFIIKV